MTKQHEARRARRLLSWLTGDIPTLCRGEPVVLDWVAQASTSRLISSVAILVAASGIYGMTVGAWKGPLQAAYSGLKIPLLILLTVLVNSLANWMLAQVLGVTLRFRQTLWLILMSYVVASVVLLSLAPVALYLVFCVPQTYDTQAQSGHAAIVLAHVALIALAGVGANLRFFRILERVCSPRPKLARPLLFCWLAGNLIVGAQLSWNLRPFMGNPDLEIRFLAPHPFEGNFYEAVYSETMRLVGATHQGAP